MLKNERRKQFEDIQCYNFPKKKTDFQDIGETQAPSGLGT